MKNSVKSDLTLILAISGLALAGSSVATMASVGPFEELDRETARENLNEAIEDVEEAEEYLEWFDGPFKTQQAQTTTATSDR